MANEPRFIIPDVRRISIRSWLAGYRYAISLMQGKLRQLPPPMPPEQIIDGLISEEMERDE